MSGQTLALDVRIDKEFRALIPPPTAEELAQLRENIVTDGCRESLVVWRGILLDGHNRYDICTDEGIDFETIEVDLPDREAAYNWIIDNQLGRRNLTPDQASYLRGKRYNREKQQGRRSDLTSDQNDTKLETAERLAEEFGVSSPTIKRDGAFAKAVDTLAVNAGEEARTAILAGDAPLTKAEVVSLAKEPPERQREAVQAKMAVHYSSETPEWYTPASIIERTVKLFGKIDLDPCSNSREAPNVPAEDHFTKDDDGLAQVWSGKVYMNPPYGREIIDWTRKLREEYEAGKVKEAIALVPSRTDTEWFRELRDHPRCFVWGRLNFSGSDNSAPFPSMVVYLGRRSAAFLKAFGDIGDVYSRLS